MLSIHELSLPGRLMGGSVMIMNATIIIMLCLMPHCLLYLDTCCVHNNPTHYACLSRLALKLCIILLIIRHLIVLFHR